MKSAQKECCDRLVMSVTGKGRKGGGLSVGQSYNLASKLEHVGN